MSTNNEVRYLASHEWGRIDEEGILTVGISNHAQDLLGDIVFVELPGVLRKRYHLRGLGHDC